MLLHDLPPGQCGAALEKAAGLLFLMALGSDPCGFSVQVFSRIIMHRFFSQYLNLAVRVLLEFCPSYLVK